MIITPKRLGALAVVAALSTSGFAFMNANNVSSSGAGSGSGPVYGYNVSNISYSVQQMPSGPMVDSNGPGSGGNMQKHCTYLAANAMDKTMPMLGQICDVSFKVAPTIAGEPAATHVEASLTSNATGGIVAGWVSCTLTAGPDANNNTFWDCNFNGPQPIKPITGLQVRATS